MSGPAVLLVLTIDVAVFQVILLFDVIKVLVTFSFYFLFWAFLLLAVSVTHVLSLTQQVMLSKLRQILGHIAKVKHGGPLATTRQGAKHGGPH